ncbi:type I secretion system permease/ATPase [Burkholderiaceae bacterium DAT-1]|nr:type I secretion system permease/ATPase [Burkholderiaceae bacterium DAT-1]
MENEPNGRSELRAIVDSLKGAALQLSALSAVINMLMLAPAIYMMQIFDRVMSSRNLSTLFMLTLLGLALVALMAALEVVRSHALIRIGNKIDLTLSPRVFTAAFERNLQRAGGNPSQAMYDVTTLRQFLTGTAPIAIFDAPWGLLYLGLFMAIHWAMACVFLIGIVLLGGITWLSEVTTKAALSDASTAGIAASNYANNNLQNAEVIEALGMLPSIRTRWFHFQSRVLSKQTEAADRAAVLHIASKIVRMLLMCAVMAVGVVLNIEDKLSAGMMTACMMLMGRALQPIDMVITSWKQIFNARTAWSRLDKLLKEYPVRDENMSLPAPIGEVTVENVSLTPPGAMAPVLKSLNFTIRAGDIVGVIGQSASGKSSLARALVGVWATQTGSVRLDGHDVHAWNKAELGPCIGYMPQDTELFEGTVGENISRFGELDATKVVEAAMRAGVHDMIQRLPKGYDTKLGVGGSMLSGGQRQRIGLARALYGNPSLLVLDEPNASLDELGEQALVRAMIDLQRRGKTVIVITHRTSILNVVDKLMVLNDGSLQLYGPRDQVLSVLINGNPAPSSPSVEVAGQT